MQRRNFLTYAATLPVVAMLPTLARAEDSPLIYLSPVKSDGALSACQAEVWFVADGKDFCVVTADDAWRSRAVQQGLTQAKVWIGDVGPWNNADGKWHNLPSVMTNVAVERDGAQHSRLLEIFGRKYSAEWGTWGPRFKKGLADGSRVMLRYSPA